MKNGNAGVALVVLLVIGALLAWNTVKHYTQPDPEPVNVTVSVVPVKEWPSFTCQEDEIMAWLDRGTRQAECVNIEEFEAAL